LFRRGDYRNGGHNPEKLLGLSPDEDSFWSSETKHGGSKTKAVCFGGEITETKITNPKTVLDSSPGEDRISQILVGIENSSRTVLNQCNIYIYIYNKLQIRNIGPTIRIE
jgi:hypothetical protein